MLGENKEAVKLIKEGKPKRNKKDNTLEKNLEPYLTVTL